MKESFQPTDWFTLGFGLLLLVSILFVLFQLRAPRPQYSRLDAALHYLGLCAKRRNGRRCAGSRSEHMVNTRFYRGKGKYSVKKNRSI